MKKMYFENASLELIRFSADVITSSGEEALDVTGTRSNDLMSGNILDGDNIVDNVF